MNNNFLGIRGLYKTHMDGLKPFNSKSVTYTYIGYSEHNSRGQPIVRHATNFSKKPVVKCVGFYFQTLSNYSLFFQRVSYRSSWLNLLIYGNFIHILGYMILSAWIASLLEKAGVRKF